MRPHWSKSQIETTNDTVIIHGCPACSGQWADGAITVPDGETRMISCPCGWSAVITFQRARPVIGLTKKSLPGRQDVERRFPYAV